MKTRILALATWQRVAKLGVVRRRRPQMETCPAGEPGAARLRSKECGNPKNRPTQTLSRGLSMRKLAKYTLIALLGLSIIFLGTPLIASAAVPAFPGAQGGGRGLPLAVAVERSFLVTNLNVSGPGGSYRHVQSMHLGRAPAPFVFRALLTLTLRYPLCDKSVSHRS